MNHDARDRAIWQDSESGYDAVLSEMPIQGHQKLILDREDAYSLDAYVRFQTSAPCWSEDKRGIPQADFTGIPKNSYYDGLHYFTTRW